MKTAFKHRIPSDFKFTGLPFRTDHVLNFVRVLMDAGLSLREILFLDTYGSEQVSYADLLTTFVMDPWATLWFPPCLCDAGAYILPFVPRSFRA